MRDWWTLYLSLSLCSRNHCRIFLLVTSWLSPVTPMIFVQPPSLSRNSFKLFFFGWIVNLFSSRYYCPFYFHCILYDPLVSFTLTVLYVIQYYHYVSTYGHFSIIDCLFSLKISQFISNEIHWWSMKKQYWNNHSARSNKQNKSTSFLEGKQNQKIIVIIFQSIWLDGFLVGNFWYFTSFKFILWRLLESFKPQDPFYSSVYYPSTAQPWKLLPKQNQINVFFMSCLWIPWIKASPWTLKLESRRGDTWFHPSLPPRCPKVVSKTFPKEWSDIPIPKNCQWTPKPPRMNSNSCSWSRCLRLPHSISIVEHSFYFSF